MNFTNSTTTIIDRNNGFSSLSFLFIPGCVISIAGIPGTFVTMRFYGKQINKAKNATSLMLTSLSVFDMLSLICGFFMSSVAIYLFYIDGWKQDRLFPISNAVTRLPKHCSNLTLVIIGVERVMCVAWPHKVKAIFTKKVGIVCIVLICTFVAPLSLVPMALEPDLVAVTHPDDPEIYVRRLPQAIMDPDIYSGLYQMTVFMYFGLPLGGVFISNFVLSVLLLKRWRSKTNTPGAGAIPAPAARELRITKIVMAVTAIFFICIFPVVVIFPIQTSSGADIPMKGMRLIMPLTLLLENITYSMNAVVYYIGNVTFRKEVRFMMRRYQRKPAARRAKECPSTRQTS